MSVSEPPHKLPPSSTSSVFSVHVCGVSQPQQVIVRNGMRVLDVVAHLALENKMTSFVVMDSAERTLSLNMKASAVGGDHILILKPKSFNRAKSFDDYDGPGPSLAETSINQVDAPVVNLGSVPKSVELPVPPYLKTAEQQLVKEELFLKNLEMLLDHYCPLLEKYVFSLDEFETFRCWLSNTHHFVKLMHDKLSEFIKYYSELSAHRDRVVGGSGAGNSPRNPSPSTTVAAADFWSTSSTISSSGDTAPGSKILDAASFNSCSPETSGGMATPPNCSKNISNELTSTSKIAAPANNIFNYASSHLIPNASNNYSHHNSQNNSNQPFEARTPGPGINNNNNNYYSYNYLQSNSGIVSGDPQHPEISSCLNRNLWQTLYSYISNFHSSQKKINRALECNKDFYNACQTVRGSSKQSLMSLLHRPVQKLSEYSKWLEQLCCATPVGSAEYTSLNSHALIISRLLAQQNKLAAMPTVNISAIPPKEDSYNVHGRVIHSAVASNQKHSLSGVIQKDSILSRLKPSPPHLGLASKETYKVNGASKNTVLSSSSTTRKISSSYPLESSRGHVNSSPVHPNLNNSTNLTVAAVKRNAKRRGPANRLRRKSLPDLGELTIMKGGVPKVNDPADESSYDGGKFILESTIKLVHKNSITDCCLFLYEYNLAVAQMMDSENALHDENALLQIRYDVPITDIWIAAPPNQSMRGANSKSMAIDDGTSDVSLLIGWPIINVKFIFQSVESKDSFLDHLLVAIERSLYSPLCSSCGGNSPDSTMEDIAGNAGSQPAPTLPIIVHNEFTSSKTADTSFGLSSSSLNSNGYPTSDGITSSETRSNHNHTTNNNVSAITTCDVDPLSRVDILIDQICGLAEPQPCCAWIRYGKKNSNDYMALIGYERLYPIVNFCYPDLKYSKKKSGSFSTCHLYITKYGKYPSDHPENKEKVTNRKISMSNLLPGSGNINKHKLSLGSPTNFSSFDHGVNPSQHKFDLSGDAKFGIIDETTVEVDSNERTAIFGRPLSEICVNSLPPIAIKELLYAIYVRCPTIQGVFRIPCAASKKQEFKTQLDAGNLPKDWLSADLPPNLLCDTLKDFLQHIPGGVFGIPTKVLMKSHSKGFLHFKETLLNIPVVNYQLLVRVVYVLAACLEGQASSLPPDKRLNLDSLMICIAPTIFKDATTEMLHSTKPNGKNTLDVKKLLSFIMENRESLFADFWNFIASEFEKASVLWQQGELVFVNETEMLDTTMQQRRTDSLLTSERKKPFISVGGSSFQPRMALPYKQHDFNSTDMDLLLMGKRPTGFDSSGDFMKYTDYNIQTCSGLQSGSSPSGNSLDSGIATAVTNDCLNEPSPSLSSSVAPITVAPNVMHLKQVFENDASYDSDVMIKSAPGELLHDDSPSPPFRNRIPMPPARNTSHIDDKSRSVLASEALRKISQDSNYQVKELPRPHVIEKRPSSQGTHHNNVTNRPMSVHSPGSIYHQIKSPPKKLSNPTPTRICSSNFEDADVRKLSAVRHSAAPFSKSTSDMSFRSSAFLCDVYDSDEDGAPQFV